MRESRGSRCSPSDELIIYVDGIPLDRPRKDSGCYGEVHKFTTSTTLINPTYQWSLDGISPPKPLLGTESSYSYTFDDQRHQLFCVAKSLTSECSIQLNVEVTGLSCLVCPVICATETAYVPVGKLISLTDWNGIVYPIAGDVSIECKSYSQKNKLAVKSILRTIKVAAGCQSKLLNASIYMNTLSSTCLTLTITNSPIRFTSIQIEDSSSTFNMTKC